MKKLCILIGLTAALYGTAVQAAMSVTLSQDLANYSYGNGGEFRANASGGLEQYIQYYSSAASGNGYFQTFCIEHGENFTPGASYDVTISQNALNGGQGAGGDPISLGTAWLYSQFAAGTLSGYEYDYGHERTVTAGALQAALWYFENETGGANNTFTALAATELGKLGFADPFADANGKFNVRALNLSSPGTVQDQLVVVPEPTTVLAGALLLLPFGVSTLRVLRRSRRT